MLPGHEGSGYDRAELEAVADRIRRRVDALGVEVATADGPLTVGDLSVSVGGATFPDDAADLDGLLEVADSALYAAKRPAATPSGWDCTCMPPSNRGPARGPREGQHEAAPRRPRRALGRGRGRLPGTHRSPLAPGRTPGRAAILA